MSRYSELEAAGIARLQAKVPELVFVRAMADAALVEITATPAAILVANGARLQDKILTGTSFQMTYEVKFTVLVVKTSSGVSMGDARGGVYDLAEKVRSAFIGWRPVITDVTVFPTYPIDEEFFNMENGRVGFEMNFAFRWKSIGAPS